MSHLTRPSFSREHPLHVTLRVSEGIGSLRGAAVMGAIRGALGAGRERMGLRLVLFAVNGKQLDLLVEARDRRALARGLQGLCIRVAKAINRQLDRHGRVFADRYEARALKTPGEARAAVGRVVGPKPTPEPGSDRAVVAPRTRLLRARCRRTAGK